MTSELTPVDEDEHEAPLRLPRGFHDLGPEQAEPVLDVERRWFSHARLWGYCPVRIPPVGFASTFTSGHHAAGQRTFRFNDRKGRALALVSDSLPAATRLAHVLRQPDVRIAFSCPVFRYERRPMRYFHQIGVLELVEGDCADTDREQRSVERLLEVLVGFLRSHLAFEIHLTDVALWRMAVQSAGATVAEASHRLHELSLTEPTDRPALLERAGAAAFVRFAAAVAEEGICDPLGPAFDRIRACTAPRVAHRLERLAQLARTTAALSSAPVRMNLGDLHASEFHDGLAFQIFLPAGRRRFGDGGSYGAFAHAFLRRQVGLYSAVLGLERTAREMAMVPRPASDILLSVGVDPEAKEMAHRIASELRGAGHSVWEGPARTSPKKDIRNAAVLGIAIVMRIDTDEVRTHRVRIRTSGGELADVSLSELARWLQDHRAAARIDEERTEGT